MACPKPHPHFLVFYVKDNEHLEKVGPTEYESYCAAHRAHREARAKHGANYSSSNIYPVGQNVD